MTNTLMMLMMMTMMIAMMMILITMQWDGDDEDEDGAAVTIVYLRGHRCTKRVTNQKNMKMITTVEEDEFR